MAGRPNAGKSSLFNRLLERPRAIVTPLPGTTRDTVEEVWSLAGIPVRLIDTAGLRLSGDSPADEAERQGIERSREALADADSILLVHDATAPLTPEEQSLVTSLEGRPYLVVRNKIDLLLDCVETAALGEPIHAGTAPINVSALTGAGPGESPLRTSPAVAGGRGVQRNMARSTIDGSRRRFLMPCLPSKPQTSQTAPGFPTRCSCWICTMPFAPSTASLARRPPTTSWNVSSLPSASVSNSGSGTGPETRALSAGELPSWFLTQGLLSKQSPAGILRLLSWAGSTYRQSSL